MKLGSTAKKTKWIYYKVIQQKIAGVWEDADWHECDSSGWIRDKEARDLLRYNIMAYRSNQPQYPVRVVRKKELRKEEN